MKKSMISCCLVLGLLFTQYLYPLRTTAPGRYLGGNLQTGIVCANVPNEICYYVDTVNKPSPSNPGGGTRNTYGLWVPDASLGACNIDSVHVGVLPPSYNTVTTITTNEYTEIVTSYSEYELWLVE